MKLINKHLSGNKNGKTTIKQIGKTLSFKVNQIMDTKMRLKSIFQLVFASTSNASSSKQSRQSKSSSSTLLLSIVAVSFILFTLNCDTNSQSTFVSAQTTDSAEKETVKKCNSDRHAEMDKCASSLGFLGDRTFVMPKNITSMDNFCGTLTKSLKCIQNYARECLSSFPRQVLLTVTRNGRKQYNQLCANNQTKQEFMEKLTCLAPENLEQLHQCMDGSIARFEYVANRVEADNRISAICCSYQIFRRDIQETVEKSCSAYPNVEATAHYLHEIISTTTGELIDLVCGAYKTFEDCKAKPKMAALVSTFTDITSKIKKKQIKPKARSLISLFINILNSF